MVFLSNIKEFVVKHILFGITLFLSLFLVRLIELSYLGISIHKVPSLGAMGMALNMDAFFSLSVSFVFFPLILLNFLGQRWAGLVYKTLITLLLFVHIALTHFYLTTGVLLSSLFMNFTAQDILQISMAELSLSRLAIWIIYPVVFFFAHTSYNRIKQWTIHLHLQTGMVVAYALAFAIIANNKRFYYKALHNFDSYFDYYFGNNKSLYLLKTVFEDIDLAQKMSSMSKEELLETIRNYQALNPDFTYISKEFPLLTKHEINNVLGPFFPEQPSKPNIVFLCVESLSGAFTGKNTHSGHFTPFVDSLIDHSLYWSNFLSNAEHSYGVLPHVLSSSPYGNNGRGFVNLPEPYPQHSSIIQLLKQNEYQANSYYGGELFFDNVGNYMRYVGLNCAVHADVFDKQRFTRGNSKINPELNWGYNDKDLFEQSFEFFKQKDKNKPFVDVFITLSLHSPFNLATDEYFDKNYLKKRLFKLNPNFDSLYEYSDKRVISTALFTDDALRMYFEYIKTKPEFNNTIFIITGDHRVDSELERKSEIDYYHVPLLIYSPMLTQPKQFKGVCGHIDIVPSLVELLKQNFGMEFDYQQQWVGKGLDTSATYHNDRSFHLSLFSNTYPSFLHHNYLMAGDNVVKLKPDFTTERVTDKAIIDSMLNIIHSYRIINKYVCDNDKVQRKK